MAKNGIARSELFKSYDAEEQRQRPKNGIARSELFRQPSAPQQQPEQSGGVLDFLFDNLAAGTGRSLQTLGENIEAASRPENKLPSEWHEQVSPWIRSLQDAGREMYERNAHQYEPESVPYYLSQMIQSTPESLAIMAGAAGTGWTLGGPVGALGNTARTALTQIPAGLRLLGNLAKVYQSAGVGGKIARTLTPNSQALVAAPTGALMEAAAEKRHAVNEFIENAKRNGTYVKDRTELEAENFGDRVYWDNAAVISMFNTPQYNMILGKPVRGLLGKLGRFVAAMASEGAEEASQEVIPPLESGEPIDWRRVQDAAIVGAGMGGIFHGAGTLANYAANRTNQLDKNANGQGRYWQPQNDNVSFDGAQPKLLNAVDMLGKWFYERTGKKLIVTSGTDGSSHMGGEHSHYNGWKVDVNDWDGVSDGYLVTADGSKGTLTDEFIAYGRSLGLGMNWEGDHIDVALDGTQWDGNGNHAGGFNPRNSRNPAQEKNNSSSIDNFMRAIVQQESGGNYDVTNADSGAAGAFQIMPENWPTWAKDAGLAPNAPMTPENQNHVARNKMLEYFNKFGNWRDVAIAWYGGEGAVSWSEEAKNRPQGKYPSVNEYADSVMAHFENFGGEVQSRDENISDARISQPSKQEPTKPLFDISADDEQTQKLFEQFARERRDASTGAQAAEDSVFFGDMFTDKDKFRNTPENRQAIIERYGDDFDSWRQTQQEQQSAKPKPPKPAQNQQGSPFLNNPQLTEAVDKLRERAIANNDLQFFNRLETARKNADSTELEQLLRQHSVKTPPQENSPQNVVQNNTPPENILPQSNRFKIAVVQHQDLGTRFSAKGAIPHKIFDDMKSLAKKYGGFKDNAYGNGFLFETAEQRDAFVQAADALIDNMPTEENSQPRPQPQVQTPPQPAPVQPQTQPKRATPTDLEPKILKIIPDDKFVSDEEILMQTDDVEPNELPNILLGLQLKGNIVEDAGRYKRLSTPQENSPKTDKFYGNDAEIDTDSDKTHAVRYRVVEADELTASHELTNMGVFENEDYVRKGGIQPRDRTTSEQQESIFKQAGNLNPNKALDPARNVNFGAPTIRNDGLVFNGNRRVMALNYAYKNGKADAYKTALINRAAEFGLNSDEISKMNQPVLVKELVDDLTQEELADIAGTTSGGTASLADEQAFKDAKKIRAESLKLFPKTDVEESVDLTANNFSDFVGALLQDIATTDEMAALSKNGKLTQEGLTRVKRALFASAYGDPKLVETMAASTDDNAKNVTIALTNAAVDFAKVRTEIQRGELVDYDLDALTDAVKKLSALRNEGKSVKDYLNEIKLGEQDSEELRQILSALDKFKRSQPKLTRFVKSLARRIREKGKPVHDTLFGTQEPASLLELIHQARDATENNDQADLFAQQENSAQDTKPRQAPPQKINESEVAAVLHDRLKTDTHHYLKKLLNDVLSEKTGGRDFGRQKFSSVLVRPNIPDEEIERWELVAKTLVEAVEIFHGNEYPENKDVVYHTNFPNPESTPLQDVQKWREKTLNAFKHDAKIIIGSVNEVFSNKTKPKKSSADADKSIRKNQAAIRELSEKIINDAAKNPDTARALEQLGATVKNGKVTFPDNETFQACVNFVNSGILKSSQRGNVDTAIKNFLEIKDLNPLQKSYADFAKEMGVPILFFRGNKNFHGAHANGISFYNVDAKFSHDFVYWHEFGHWLKNNQPKLFNQLLDAAEITDEQVAEKKKSRPDLNDAELKEEIICDAMSDVARRTGLLKQVGKKNSSLIQRIVSWAKSTLDRFTDWFHTRERGLTTEQRAKMKDAFGKIARQIADANGNKIFRYNNQTHELELADGRKLPRVGRHSENRGAFKFDERPTIKFSREVIQAQENSGTTQVSGTKSMYVKAIQHLRKLKGDIETVLDYGAGLGVGTDAMRENNSDLHIDSYEPNPPRWQGKVPPNYTVNTQIQSHYDAILNTNVLNVVEPKIRDLIVRDIGTLLNVNGVAMITTRSWKGDIENTKNYTLGKEPHSVWIPKVSNGKTVRVYQKGFDGNELVNYVSDILGEDFRVEKVSGFGKSGVIVTRIADSIETSSKPKFSFAGRNENSATAGERREISAGYYTASGRSLQRSNKNEFIVDENGNRNLGRISEDVAENSGGKIKALPVRLKVGFHSFETWNGEGYKHIKAKHLRSIEEHGFDNAIDFIKYTLNNFNKAYEHPTKDNRIILFCDDDSRGFMPLELINEVNYYKVVTAFPKESANINGELVYDRSETLPTVTADGTTERSEKTSAEKTDDKGGVDSSAANVETNSPRENIPQENGKSKPKFSTDAGEERGFFKKITDKFAKALHLNGDKIVTEEDQRKSHRQAQEKAMADYLKEPTKENKQHLEKLGVTKGQLDAYMNGEEYATQIGLIKNYRLSPSRIAEKVAVFRAFFHMGDRAMDKLVKLRDGFSRKYDAAMSFVKSKEEREQLIQLLWDGDEEQREFGKLTEEKLAKIKADNPDDTTKAIQRAKVEKICEETNVSENVAKAYLAIRRQLERAYTLLDESRRRPKNYAKYLSDKQYEKLRDNKFVKQGTLKIHDVQDEDGKHLVTWTEYANYERDYNVDEATLDKLKADDAIQVLNERKNPDGTYKVTVREGIPALKKLGGYVPHFFHEYTAIVRAADGKQIGNIIGTGRTQREAIKVAEEWQKNHRLKAGEQIYVMPHTFNFGMGENYTPIMGDKDFEVMMSRIAKNTGTTLAEAKEILNGAVKLKNRHRFLGQLLHRKGYAGYEKDMDWVLRHHFNTVARYVALETEFKPKAISLFERVFGAFDKDHSKNLLAQYTKDYINDVNGVPAWIDEVVNKTLNQNYAWRKIFMPLLGEKGFQRIGNSVAGRIAYLKLGMGNKTVYKNLNKVA